MFGHDFYHGTLRRYVILFGNLFNELQIKRFDSSGSNVINNVSIPIAYGPKQKAIERALADPTGFKSIAITLPRMTFAMSSLSYAPSRKLNSSLKLRNNVFDEAQKTFNNVYAPVPYDMGFTLSVLTKNAEDGTQIIEQILPFFTPDYTVTMKALPNMSLNLDVPIELTSVSSDDSYEGDFDIKRVLTWDLTFTVKGYLFGPVNKSKYIAEVDINLFDGEYGETTTKVASIAANTTTTTLS
jgi:T4-like virus Myoviridae tail sheath stabiliser